MKTENICVAFFAVGSALKFTEKKLLRSDGTNEYFVLANLLLKNTSISRVLLLSKSDWSRLTTGQRMEIDPHNKIWDPYTEIPILNHRPKPTTEEIKKAHYETFFAEMMQRNIVADFGIGFISQGWGTVTMPGFLNNMRPPHDPVKTLDMTFHYASEIIYYLGMTNLPWFLLATDPRYVKPSMRLRDTVNIPKKILGQQDFDINWFHAKAMDQSTSVANNGYEDFKHKSYYTGIEKLNLVNDGTIDPETTDKPIQFTIVAMQLTVADSKKDSRFDILKEYVLDRDTEQKARIFGKWSDKYKGDYAQFKGYAPTEEMDQIFIDSRYTLVLPTDAGWVTSKYAEMLQLGVIPFFHPKYDSQCHVVPKNFPLRVKSADDFYAKMEYFDKNPKERIAFAKHLQDSLIGNAYSGKFMINLFNKSLKEFDINVVLDTSTESLYEKPHAIKSIIKKENQSSLEDFFG